MKEQLFTNKELKEIIYYVLDNSCAGYWTNDGELYKHEVVFDRDPDNDIHGIARKYPMIVWAALEGELFLLVKEYGDWAQSFNNIKLYTGDNNELLADIDFLAYTSATTGDKYFIGL